MAEAAHVHPHCKPARGHHLAFALHQLCRLCESKAGLGVCDGCPDAVVTVLARNGADVDVLRRLVLAALKTDEGRNAAAELLEAFNRRHGGTSPPTGSAEEIEERRARRFAENPGDPYGGMHWLVARGEILDFRCGICREPFKEGDPVTAV